jgi:hypothetical protein
VIDDARQRLVLGVPLHGRASNRTTLGGEPFSLRARRVHRYHPHRAWRLVPGAHAAPATATWWRCAPRFAGGRNNLVCRTPRCPAAGPRRYRLWQAGPGSALALGDGGGTVAAARPGAAAGDRLVPLEQLSLGGRHTVRGYRENQLVRDSGWADRPGIPPWPLWGGDGRPPAA